MSDNLTIELVIQDGNADVAIGRNKQKLQEFVRDVEKAQPKIKFNIPNQNYIDLDKLEKRAAETRKQFQNITASRLDSGQISGLTRELVKAQERSRILASDISNIKKELANPNRKSSIAFLTEELRGAEKEASQLERKLQTLGGTNAVDGKNAVDGFTRMVGGRDGTKLSAFQKQNLSYQANDVISGLAMGQSPLQILTQQSGQIAQIFSPAQATALVAAYAPLVGILAGGAAAIALTYKVTGDIRAEAERRLKVEEKITSAINNQRLAQQKAFEELQKSEQSAQRARTFQRGLDGETIAGLTERRNRIQQLITPNMQGVSLVPASLPVIKDGKVVQEETDSFKTLSNELSTINRQLDELRNKQKDFNKGTIFQDILRIEAQSREAAITAERKRIELAEKFQASVDQGKEKVNQLEKTLRSTFDNLFQKSANDNPISTFFLQADKQLRELRENLKGASPELKAIAESLFANQSGKDLFGLNLDNRLQSFDLRDQARNFRNPFDSTKLKQEEDKFIERFLFNNPNYLFLKNKSSLDDEARRDILSRGLFDTPEKRLNDKLDQQFNLLFSNNLNNEQQTVADKRFLSLTQGVNPLDLDSRNRERAAQVREREAIRVEQYQNDALRLQRETLQVNKQIAENQRRLIGIAETQGAKGIENILKIVDETEGRVRISKAPNRQDTNLLYGNSNGLTNF